MGEDSATIGKNGAGKALLDTKRGERWETTTKVRGGFKKARVRENA